MTDLKTLPPSDRPDYSVCRRRFEKTFGRPPRMWGKLDYLEAMAIQELGGEVVAVTCVGDDIESYIQTVAAQDGAG
jgi:hypothetical protein